MKREDVDKQEIEIYWWNLGTKKLDFKGSYKEYFAKVNITIEEIVRLSILKGYKFGISLSNTEITLNAFDPDNYALCCDEAIRIYLTILGDKARFINVFGKEYKINWK